MFYLNINSQFDINSSFYNISEEHKKPNKFSLISVIAIPFFCLLACFFSKIVSNRLQVNKHNAAKIIQTAFKGHRAHLILKDRQERNAKRREEASTNIQSTWRRYSAKKNVEKLKRERAIKCEKATITIQTLWRKYSTRKSTEELKRNILGFDLFKKAKEYIDDPSKLKNIPRASAGKTTVFLPKELPVVLKASGSPSNQVRFNQMMEAKKICEKNKYTQLIIPKSRVNGNFIIESKLPISQHNLKKQIGFYIENRDTFSLAVTEFVGFLCQSDLFDITDGCTKDMYVGVGRYDNLPLYIEDNQGKIGLIDLERFNSRLASLKLGDYIFKCRQAIQLFPLHMDIIVDAVKNFCPQIENEEILLSLQETRDEMLGRFRFIYDDHLAFIKKNNIGFNNPDEMIEIKQDQREKIKQAIINKLPQICEQNLYEDQLKEKLNALIPIFESNFPSLFDSLLEIVSLPKFIKERGIDLNSISSYHELLSLRTITFSTQGIAFRDAAIRITSQFPVIYGDDEFWDSEIKKSFMIIVIEEIFKILSEEKIIAYLQKNVGGRSDQYLMHY